MFQLNLTRQEKNVLLVVVFAALAGMSISYLFRMMPVAEKIYASSFSKTPAKVNLNTATIAELIKVSGIGPKTAERIVEFRLTNGKFSDVNQLRGLKGVNQKNFEKIKPFIIIE